MLGRVAPLCSTFALVLACAAASPAWGWREVDGPPANVRPFFSVGYSAPLWFEDIRRGAGLSLGLEVERMPAVSFIARLDIDRMLGDRSVRYDPEFAYYPIFSQRRFSVIQWSTGARCYARSRDSLRPYGEFDVGVRYAGVGPEGIALNPRLGIAWAGYGEAGIALDLGYEFSVRDTRRYGIMPVRVAVTFP